MAKTKAKKVAGNVAVVEVGEDFEPVAPTPPTGPNGVVIDPSAYKANVPFDETSRGQCLTILKKHYPNQSPDYHLTVAELIDKRLRRVIEQEAARKQANLTVRDSAMQAET